MRPEASPTPNTDCSCTIPATLEACAGAAACSIVSALDSLPDRWRRRIAFASSLGWRVTPRGGPCWAWQGSDSGDGYGKTKRNGRDCMAHRAVFEHVRGPIPARLVLDHLCRFRACVNPWHTAPASTRDNTLSGDSVLFAPRGAPGIRAALYSTTAAAPVTGPPSANEEAPDLGKSDASGGFD